MARMLNLRNVFELIINGFNDAAFSQQNLIEQGDDFGFHVFLELGDQFNVVHGQKFSELLGDVNFVAEQFANAARQSR